MPGLFQRLSFAQERRMEEDKNLTTAPERDSVETKHRNVMQEADTIGK
jgi:hypothetical protein